MAWFGTFQLKSSHTGSSTADVKVDLHLAKKPSGCVIWVWFDPRTLRVGPFLWFGSKPGLHLPNLSTLKLAKHQVWVDVSSHPSRGREQADLIRKRVLERVIKEKR